MENRLISKRLIAIFILAIILFGGLATYRALKFHIISTDPATNNVAAISPFLKLNFSRPINPNSLQFTASKGLVSSFAVKGRQVVFNLNVPLVINQQYSITIRSISSTNGASLVNKSFTFTAQNIPTNQLTKDQQQALLQSQVNYSKSHYSDPILKHLPYGSLTFNLTATTSVDNGTAKLTLNAELLLSDADNSDRQAAINQDTQDVLNYIKSLGLNPSGYNIVYTTNM